MASTIAEAYVQILPSAEGISGNLTKTLSGEAGAAGTAASSSFSGKFTRGLATVGKVGAAALTAATTAVVGFGKSAITAGSDFDSAMSQVAATMGYTTAELSDSTSEASQNIEKLTAFAEQMGSETAFSASEAAEGLNILAMAGYDTEAQMKTLPDVLNLASAGGISLADAADYATGILAGFSNETKTAGDVADLLATISSSAKGDVQSFGEGLSTVAGMATTTGQSMEDMTVALGILGNNNYSASEAGNALNRTLKNIYQATDPAKEAMAELGVSAYTTEGEARPLQEVLVDLNNSLAGMSEEAKNAALSDIFDSATLKSVPALLNNAEDSWNDLQEAIDGAKGSAEAMKEVQLDNLQGDITKFQSALEGVKISVSNELTPTLREFVSFGTSGLSQLKESFDSGGMEAAVSTFGDILSQFQTKITTMLPDIVSGGASILTSLVSGLVQNASTIATSAVSIVTTLTTTIMTLLPQLLDAGLQILAGIISGIAQSLPNLIESGIAMIEQIGNAIIDNIDLLIDASIQLLDAIITGVTENIDNLVDAAVTIVSKLLTALLEEAPTLITAGMELVLKLINGLIDAIPNLTSSGHDLVSNLITAISDNLPLILETGIDMLLQLTAGLIEAIPDLISNVDDIIVQMQSVWLEFDWISIGKSIITGIVNGLTNSGSLLVDAAKNAAKSAYDSACNFLQINSPSKLFRDGVGAAIPEGMAVGIEKNEGYVTEAMNDLSDVTASSINYNEILNDAKPYSAAYESGNSDITAGTRITIQMPVTLGDTTYKEEVAEFILTKTGNEVRATRIAEGGYY